MKTPVAERGEVYLFHARTLTRYVREMAGGKVLAEYGSDVSAGPEFKYIYAGSQRIAMYDKTGKLHFFLNDHLGSTRLVIDSAGVVKDKYNRYFAYGGGANQTISTGQKYRYTGQPFDDDGAFDLYYYGARYYDPVLGRFTSRDAMASKYPGWSPYAYTLDNPIKSIDPNGKWVETGLDVASVGLSARDFVNDPSWANAGWLALDVIGAVTPFLPAVGIVRHAGKAAKAVKRSDRAADIARDTKRGLESEKTGLNALGLEKNTKKMSAVDPKTKEMGATIPDGIRANGQTVELKDRDYLSDTPQLRRQSEISAESGQQAQVVLMRDTKVSKTVKERMDVQPLQNLEPQK